MLYINDLEKDPDYNYWPSQLTELLRPAYPGMLKHVRKNIHNVVMVMKPSDPCALTLLKLVATLLENSAPVRIGRIEFLCCISVPDLKSLIAVCSHYFY